MRVTRFDIAKRHDGLLERRRSREVADISVARVELRARHSLFCGDIKSGTWRRWHMKIYWIKAQAPRRVLALIKHLGLEVQCIEMDMMAGGLKTPEYAGLNPNMKAPTLVDGERILWESTAIMAYLCMKCGSNMWPTDRPMEQIEILRWLSWNDCHWAPAVAPFYFEHIVKKTFGIGDPDNSSLQSKGTELLRYGRVLDDRLADRRFIACDRLTIADFQLASMATYWDESGMPFTNFPNIVRWIANLRTIPAWKDPWPAASRYALESRPPRP
jgi:glutathione S-transferase